MNSMFSGCSSLIYLNISNFDTSSVNTMGYMFSGCKSLNSLELSNFNTSSVTTMEKMFSGCSNLIYLDLSNFNTLKVKYMNSMFEGCSSLTSLNLSNFNPSSVIEMEKMFSGCSNLTYLNLSNFNTSSVTKMGNMFFGCSLLNSIDLSSFDTSKVKYMNSMFNGCSSLINLDLFNFDTSSVSYMNNIFKGCSSLTSLNLFNFNTSKVITMNSTFYECTSLVLLDLSNFNALQVTNMDCIFSKCEKLDYINLRFGRASQYLIISENCNKEQSDFTICSEYEDWPKIFNLSENQHVNCINDINLFNFNETEYMMKCFKNNKELDNPCQICGKDYFNKSESINNNIYVNCYKIYILDDTFLSIIDSSIIEDTENLKNASNIIIKEEIGIQNRTELINNMINNLFYKLNISDIDNGNDEKTEEKNISIIMTSTKNQKNNENENMITMNLGKCEDILKNEYNISKNDPLYILQIISEVEGMKIPKIEYDVYYPFYYNNLTKLDLSLCKEVKIQISIPVKIKDSIDKYNPKSGYYNDICYKTTSESGTDISLKDRRNEFFEFNMTLCEENCDLINYNYTNEKVKCSCDVKININPNYDYKFNKKEFFKSFTDIKSITNIEVIKCYKIVFKIKNLIINYGFYIIGSIMVLYFITIFIYSFITYKKLKKDLFNMCMILNSIESKEIQPMIKENKTSIKKKIKKKLKRKGKKKKKSIKNNNINIYGINDKKNLENNNSIINNINNDIKDFEINSLEYEEAFKLDKRNYFQYYISLLKNNHPLMFSFCIHEDYNPRIIKAFLFFFSYSSDLTINALFFNDDTMHKIYKDRGKYDLLFQIPQILYSTLISKLIDSLIKTLSLSQDTMVELKQEKKKNNIKEKCTRTLKILKIKIILFYIFAFIILSCFWYYVTCFCGIYVNTQIILIKDSVISLITSLLYPFAMSLIPGLFRIPALKIKKSSGRFLYKFSSFLENYLT